MVTVTTDGWLIIKEDDGEDFEGSESIVRIGSICIVTGDDEQFTIGLVSGESYDFAMADGFAKVSRELTGHKVEPKLDTDTFGRVPV